MVRAGDDVARVRPGDRLAERLPLLDGRQDDAGGGGLLERLGLLGVGGEVGVGQLAPGGGVDGLAVADFHGAGVHAPLPGGERDEEGARRGGAPADGGHGARRASAAGGDAVVGDEVGVAHDELNAVGRKAEFLRGGLGEFRARALAALDLAGHDGDRAVFADVDPRGDADFSASGEAAPAAAPAAADRLSQDLQRHHGDEQPGAGVLQERAARHAPSGRPARLFGFGAAPFGAAQRALTLAGYPQVSCGHELHLPNLAARRTALRILG